MAVDTIPMSDVGNKTTTTTITSSDAEAEVVLNVYDLTPANNYMYWVGVGIFHSGIQVYDMEYGFGAHDIAASGVFEVEPKTCPGFIYRCSIPLGRTKMPPAEFRTFLENMASEYYGDTYHLISKNCNHFSNDLCWRLTGKHIPGWVNRLAGLGSLCSCLLPESLQVTTVKQNPGYHEVSEDESESEGKYSADDEKLLRSPTAGVTNVSFIIEPQTHT